LRGGLAPFARVESTGKYVSPSVDVHAGDFEGEAGLSMSSNIVAPAAQHKAGGARRQRVTLGLPPSRLQDGLPTTLPAGPQRIVDIRRATMVFCGFQGASERKGRSCAHHDRMADGEWRPEKPRLDRS